MAWNDLTISQRSQLMNIYRQNGVTSLSEMKRLYDLSFPSLVEGTPSPLRNAAPVYAQGGPKRTTPDESEFYGPPIPGYMTKGNQLPQPEYNIFDDETSYKRRDAHKNSLDAFIQANPTVAGLSTEDFRDILSDFAGLESSYKKDAANDSGYSGYYGLKNGKNYDANTQHRMAYEHLADMFTHNITKDDIRKGIEMGYTPAQILYKYWNQRNNATEFLQNGSASTIGNNPELEVMGNNITAPVDYFKYLPDAITSDYHVVKSGDNFSSLQERVRTSGRHYNQAGKDLKQWNDENIVNGKLHIGDTVWFTQPYSTKDVGTVNKFDLGGSKGGNLFGPGGNVLPAYPEIIRNAVKKKYLTDYVNYGRVHGYPTQAEPKSNLKQFSWAEYLTSPYSLQRDKSEVPAIMARRALLAKYAGIENGLRFNVDDYIEESPYRPSNSKDQDAKYYRMKDVGYEDRRSLFNSVAGQFKIGHGIDENGRKYVSYYDIWDLAPFSLNSGENGNDIQGTTPVELYDRFYEDEDPDYYYRVVPEERPEEKKVTFVKLNNLVNDNRSGGKIHIKKKNRGKFTALKKRTGHSASWFKAHGTPAQKKMAVFALNARKWKHSHGGIIF